MQHCVSVYSFKCPSKVFYYFILLYLFFLLLHLGDFTVHTPVISQRSEDSSFCLVLSNIGLLWLSSGWREQKRVLFLFVCYVLVEYFLMMRENHPNKWFLLELFSVFIWDIWLGHRLSDWPAQLWMVKRQHILTLIWFLFNFQYILRFLIFKN